MSNNAYGSYTPLIIPISNHYLADDMLCMTLYIHTLGYMDMYMEQGVEYELFPESDSMLTASVGCLEELLPHLCPNNGMWN